MLMKDPKKNLASIVVSKMTGTSPEMSDEKETVAAEIMSAIESKDVHALKDSLKTFIKMCLSDPSYEGE